MSDICMCIERLWPYWLLHWRTQNYGLLTIIALYIGYLITFGCYRKAKWFIVYLWKGTTTKCLVNVFMGKPRKGGREHESLRKSVRAVAWQNEVEKLVFRGNEGFYWQEHSENELLQWHSWVQFSWSAQLYTLPITLDYSVLCKQLYPALHIFLQFASLHLSLFIVYCLFDILYKSYISLVL